MEVKWLIEDYEHDGSLQPFIDEISKQGMECKIIKENVLKVTKFNQFPNEDCVVFYGSLNMGKKIQRETTWVPGIYCNWQNLCCVTYYSYWGKYLFNRDYIILPLLEIKRREQFIYDLFGIEDCIFIRPDSGAKTFTGQILKKEEIDKEFDLLKNYAAKPLDEIFTIVCSPKLIKKEWRFVVVNKEVVAWSQYRHNREKTIRGQFSEVEPVMERSCEPGALALANIIASDEWQPDRAYTIDICQHGNNFSMLEINSFSCSGLYDCDPDPIIKEISRIALDDWESYYE